MKLNKKIYSIIGILLFFAFYILLSKIINKSELPSGLDILTSFYDYFISLEIFTHIWSSLKIILIAIGISIFFGLTIIPLIYIFYPMRIIIKNYLKVFTCISVLSIYQILLLIFGINTLTRSLMLCWIAIPTFSINVIDGLNFVKDNNANVLKASLLDCPSKFKRMYRVQLPMAKKYLISSTKNVVSTCYISLLVAEMMGSSSGLGYLIMWNLNIFAYSKCYATILYIMLIYCFILLFFKIIERGN